MKFRYGYIAICIMWVLSLFNLESLRRFAHYIGPKLLSKDKRITKVIEQNLQLCMPQLSAEERKTFCSQRLALMCQTLFEMSHIWFKSPTKIQKLLLPTHDNSIFEAEMLNDNGVIVLAPHIGNWEALNVYLSQFRMLTVMYQPLKDSTLDKFVRNGRERYNSELVPTNRKGIMQIVRALRGKGLVAFLPDQVPKENAGGVFAPFFDHQAYTMTLAHKLALSSNAKVFVGSAYQCEGGFSVLMTPLPNEFYSQDAQVAATCLNKVIEKTIRYQPLQNQWEYTRFRVQPNGQESLYETFFKEKK